MQRVVFFHRIPLLFLLFAAWQTQAQEQEMEHLYAVFSASRGQGRIDAANQIVQYCYEKEHIDTLITLKTTDDEGFICVTVHDAMGGYFMYEHNDYEKSIEFLKLSLVYYQTAGNAALVNLQKNNIGANYARMGDYEIAAVYKMECYEWEKSTGDMIALSSTLNDLGVIYSQWKKPDMAIRFFEEAERVERPLNRPLYYANRLAQLAREYSTIDAPKALHLIRDALEYDEKIESPTQKEERIAVHTCTMGDIYCELNNFSDAANCYQRAHAYFEKQAKPYYAASTLFLLGRLQVKANRYGEAISTLQQCEKIAEKNGYLRIQLDASLLLSEAYSRLEPNSMSYVYHKRYSSVKDSIFRETTQQQINEFQVKYETAEKQLEIERQQAKAEKHKLLAVVLLAIAVLMTALAVVLMESYRKIRRKNIAITRQILENTRISATVATTPTPPVIKSKTHENPTFAKIESYLLSSKQYLNEDLDRNTLARQLTTNYGYVVDAIKEGTGMSFNEYINSMRLVHACTLLSDAGNNAGIENIAFECGFKNRTTFYRCFAAKYDMSPRDFRNLVKK